MARLLPASTPPEKARTEPAMAGEWSFVVWIVLMGIPLGIILASFWARSRKAGAAVLDRESPDNPH
jgi:hypothetical protein